MTTTLSSILDLTEQVQNAIDAGDWQQASDLESQRRAQLESFIAERGIGEPGGDVRTALEALQLRNQRMLGEAHHHRRRVLREASTIKTGQSAARAYESAPTEL
jgi:hypothetical protein